LADQADRHALYERAVQDPPTDVRTLTKLYRRYRKTDPRVLREDFCGSGALAVAWAKSKPTRRAIGVDIDRETLAWGEVHHLEPAGKTLDGRVKLIEANVLDARGGPKADITCALNFSYCTFRERRQLRSYFRAVRRRLADDGLFVLDVLGGTEAMMEDQNETDHGDFVYRWDQAMFDPLTHEMRCHIHFSFPDGSSIAPAFSYHWRLWTAPELRDLLLESGFSNVHVLWEKTDDEGEGTGAFYEPGTVENQECWWTYIVAER
jgi:SAM-dependent methyltransferase